MSGEVRDFGPEPWQVGGYGTDSYEIQGRIDGQCVGIAVVKATKRLHSQDKRVNEASPLVVEVPHALEVARLMAAAPALYASVLNPEDAELRERALAAVREGAPMPNNPATPEVTRGR